MFFILLNLLRPCPVFFRGFARVHTERRALAAVSEEDADEYDDAMAGVCAAMLGVGKESVIAVSTDFGPDGPAGDAARRGLMTSSMRWGWGCRRGREVFVVGARARFFFFFSVRGGLVRWLPGLARPPDFLLGLFCVFWWLPLWAWACAPPRLSFLDWLCAFGLTDVSTQEYMFAPNSIKDVQLRIMYNRQLASRSRIFFLFQGRFTARVQ